MVQLIVCQLDDNVKSKLQQQAKRYGCSTEEWVRAILENAMNMRVASVADVKSKLSAYFREAETKTPVVITRNGRSVAVLIAPEDAEDLESCFCLGPIVSERSSKSLGRA